MEVFWARRTGDPQTSAYASAKLGRMGGYRYETRATIASAALMNDPPGIRKVFDYLQVGELAPFIWKRFEDMRAARQLRRIASQVDVRWTEQIS